MDSDKWLDNILGKINKFGLENITKLETKFLNTYDTHENKTILKELNLKIEMYGEMINSNHLSDEVKENVNYGVLWELLEYDDIKAFMKNYKVPSKYFDYDWYYLPIEIRKKFKMFLKEYYDLNV